MRMLPPLLCMRVNKVSEKDENCSSSLNDIDFGEVSLPIQALVMREWADYPSCELRKA